jgi:hypothetical protein
MSLDTGYVPPNAPNGTMATYGNDRSLYVQFEEKPVLNTFRTEEEGAPTYDNVTFIEVMTPGSKNKHIERIFDEKSEWIKRFPTQWAAFKSEREQVPDGLPLTEWSVITKTEAMNLKGRNIHTVEQLAEVTDQNIALLDLGGRNLRNRAKAFLEMKVDASTLNKLMARIESLELSNKMLKESNAIDEKPAKTLKLKDS